MADVSELVGVESLIKGATYRITYAQKCMKPLGVRLFLKLRAHPRNISVKLPYYHTWLLDMSQIDEINKEKIFLNFSYWGRQFNGDPIFHIQNKDIPMPTYSEMLTAAGAINN